MKIEKTLVDTLEKSVKTVLDVAEVKQDNTYYYLPDELNQPYEQLTIDYYTESYFVLSGYNGDYEFVDVDKIVGSVDNPLFQKNNWVEAILYPRAFYKSYDMVKEHLDYYKNMCVSEKEPIYLYEKGGKYYIMDGNHRINVLKLLLLTGKDKGYSTKVRAFVRHLPDDKQYLDAFVKLVDRYHIYDVFVDRSSGYQNYTPHFKLSGSYNKPTFTHIASGVEINSIEDIKNFESDYHKGLIMIDD